MPPDPRPPGQDAHDAEVVEQLTHAIACVVGCTKTPRKEDLWTAAAVISALLNQAATARLALARRLCPEAYTHRHKKRGTLYRVIGEGHLQTEELMCDMEQVVIYQGEDGKLWARHPDEFNDGRFEPLAASERTP